MSVDCAAAAQRGGEEQSGEEGGTADHDGICSGEGRGNMHEVRDAAEPEFRRTRARAMAPRPKRNQATTTTAIDDGRDGAAIASTAVAGAARTRRGTARGRRARRPSASRKAPAVG